MVFSRTILSGGNAWTVPANESWLVEGLYCVPSSNDTYLTLYVDGTIVAKIRVKGKSGNHLPPLAYKAGQLYELVPGDLFAACRARNRPLDIPLGNGQVFTVSRYAETGDVVIRYSKWDAGDKKATDPNGSAAKLRRYLHYMTNSAALTATPASYDTSLIWSGMDSWPVAGKQAPAGRKISLLAIFAAAVSHGNNTENKGYTTDLQLMREGNLLFNDGLLGIPLGGLSTVTADAADYTPVNSAIGPQTAEQPKPGLWLPEPEVFDPGDTLTVQSALAGMAAGGIAAAELDCALLLEREEG
jgi:hypothetical protein